MSQAGILSVEGSDPQVPTQFDANNGFAIPIGNTLEILAEAVPAGSIPAQTVGSGNTITTEIQTTQAIAATDATKIGLAAFNSAQFGVDANGFVSLAGGGIAIDSVGVQSGTSPIAPTVAGLITINGSVVAAGTNPVRTDGTGPNTMAVEVQTSQAVAATDATKIGLSNFNSAQFSVDPNGFVSLAGGGLAVDSFAMQTGTSPVSPTVAGLVTFSGAVTAAGTNPVRTDGTGANTMVLEVQTSQALAAADATKIGLSNFDSSSFGVTAAGFVTASGTGLGKTITGNTGGALSPTAGNWNIVGNNNALNGFASYATGTGSTLTMNSFSGNIWVVNPTAGLGTHTTIQAAVTAASAGDTVKITAKSTPYTENITLKAGVNIVADIGDAYTPNVTISGTITHNTAGTVSITGIRLQTNSAPLLAVTGSAASIVFLTNCYINCTNNSGITYSSSSASSSISIINCLGNLSTTGINYFAHSSAGVMNILYCNFVNSGASTTVNTQSAGTLNIGYSGISSPITTSGSASLTWDHMSIDLTSQNVTAATLAGNGVQNLRYSRFMSGSASAVSIGSSTPFMEFCVVNSSNTNAVTGAGIITYSGMIFEGTSTTINVTTQTNCGTLQGSKNTAPAAGFLGERLTNSATGITLLNNTPTNVTTLALTPGVWDIDGWIYITNSGSGTGFVAQISTTSAAFTGVAGLQWDAALITGTAISMTMKPPKVRAIIPANTTYYLVGQNSFTTGASGANGFITATRVG